MHDGSYIEDWQSIEESCLLPKELADALLLYRDHPDMKDVMGLEGRRGLHNKTFVWLFWDDNSARLVGVYRCDNYYRMIRAYLPAFIEEWVVKNSGLKKLPPFLPYCPLPEEAKQWSEQRIEFHQENWRKMPEYS